MAKARKIAIKVTEQPVQEPVALVQEAKKPSRKSIWKAYIFIGIGVILVVVGALDIYTPSAKGSLSAFLLILGGLWLVYGIYSYFRAMGE
jgi:preprotein translocase subunit Sec63